MRIKLAVPALILACCFVSVLFAANTIDSFVKKAGIAQKDIEKSVFDLERLKKEFNETGVKIEGLKGLKAEGGIKGFLNGLSLKIYLSRGNRQGYRIYALEKGIAALKEDYFTYVSLITEEYSAQIKSCFENKCGELKALCDKRKEWALAADRYGDVLQIDLSSMKLIKDYSKGAAVDVREYLQKKTIQAEQRIYMLEEEKGILDIMKKAGISADAAEKKKNSDKIAALKKLKKELQLEIQKIK